MKVMDYQDETSYDFSRTDENLILYTCYPFDALGFYPEPLFRLCQICIRPRAGQEQLRGC